MIRLAFNKNIVFTGCIGSHISRQSCAINQCNGRRCRVIGDVASNFCIVRDNDRGRIALIRFTISDYNIPIDGAVFTRNIQLGFIVTSLSVFVTADIDSTYSRISFRRNIGICYGTNSICCICYSTASLAAYKKSCNRYIICARLPWFCRVIVNFARSIYC